MDLAPTLNELAAQRAVLSPEEFRLKLRALLLGNPTLALKTAAQALGVTRQRISLMAGRLDRPTCARPNKPAPKRDDARRKMDALAARVRNGESAVKAAEDLGISLATASALGFRVKKFRPSHGTKQRAASCSCRRCRKVTGVTLPRGPRTGAESRARILDWAAWADPDTGEGLKQREIGRLAGADQSVVSRIVRDLLE